MQCLLQQTLEAVDDEVGLLEVVDAIPRLQHPRQIEGQTLGPWILEGITALAGVRSRPNSTVYQYRRASLPRLAKRRLRSPPSPYACM
jgi:hypothetical protein